MSHGGEKAGGRGKRLQDGGKPDPREGTERTGRPRPHTGQGRGALPTHALPALPSPPSDATGAAAGSGPRGLRAGGRGQQPAAMTGAGLAAGGLGRTCGQRPLPGLPALSPARPRGPAPHLGDGDAARPAPTPPPRRSGGGGTYSPPLTGSRASP